MVARTFVMPAGRDALSHIPGGSGWPYVGHALEFIRDPRGLTRRFQARYGNCYRTGFAGIVSIVLLGEDALELVLRDREQAFSSELGWSYSLGRLFQGGLMLRDFDEHRVHRRIMQVAFRKSALSTYVDAMSARFADVLPRWASIQDFRFYPEIKKLTLDNAAGIFLGAELGAEADALNRAFVDMVAASLALVRVPVPGLAMHGGLRGRAFLEAYLRARLDARRASAGTDMFSQLCHATDEEGRAFSDDEVIDHVIFLLLAAHDTVTSALTTSVHHLAASPEWQERLREVSTKHPEVLGVEALDALDVHERVFDEAIRLETPVPFMPRRTVKEVHFAGLRLPPNTHVTVVPDFTHRDRRLWTDPERFDPDRFGPERAEHKRHPFAFVPFGGGAHLCIGRQFSYVLAKSFLHQLVRRYRFGLPAGRKHVMLQVPIPRPRDGLPLRLERLA
jgi:cytochrome P450